MNTIEFTLALGLASLVAGFLGALTGLGGGVVIVPLLVLVFGVDIRYAVGASLVSVIAIRRALRQPTCAKAFRISAPECFSRFDYPRCIVRSSGCRARSGKWAGDRIRRGPVYSAYLSGHHTDRSNADLPPDRGQPCFDSTPTFQPSTEGAVIAFSAFP